MFLCKKHNLVYEPTRAQMKEVMQKSAVLRVHCPKALCTSSDIVFKDRFSTKWLLQSNTSIPLPTRSVRGQLKKCDYKKNSK